MWPWADPKSFGKTVQHPRSTIVLDVSLIVLIKYLSASEPTTTLIAIRSSDRLQEAPFLLSLLVGIVFFSPSSQLATFH
jgi:hypothetical protein